MKEGDGMFVAWRQAVVTGAAVPPAIFLACFPGKKTKQDPGGDAPREVNLEHEPGDSEQLRDIL